MTRGLELSKSLPRFRSPSTYPLGYDLLTDKKLALMRLIREEWKSGLTIGLNNAVKRRVSTIVRKLEREEFTVDQVLTKFAFNYISSYTLFIYALQETTVCI